jgi:hypothetical protein
MLWALIMDTLIDRMQDIDDPHRQLPNGSGDLAFESDWEDITHPNMMSVDSWVKVRKMLQELPEGLGHVTVAVHCRKTDAGDNRDKVYSLLGLLDDTHRSSLRVDYSEQRSLLKRQITNLPRFLFTITDLPSFLFGNY